MKDLNIITDSSLKPQLQIHKVLEASGLATLAPRLRRVLASLAHRRASPPRTNRGRRKSKPRGSVQNLPSPADRLCPSNGG